MASREMLRRVSPFRLARSSSLSTSSTSYSSSSFSTAGVRSFATSSSTSPSSSLSGRQYSRLRTVFTVPNVSTHNHSIRYFGAKASPAATMSKEDITKLRNIGKYLGAKQQNFFVDGTEFCLSIPMILSEAGYTIHPYFVILSIKYLYPHLLYFPLRVPYNPS